MSTTAYNELQSFMKYLASSDSTLEAVLALEIQ